MIVADCDVADALSPLAAADRDGRRWDAAWVIVRAFTEPLALLKLPMPEDGLSRRALGEAIVRECGPTLRARVEAAGASLDDYVPRAGVTPTSAPEFLAAVSA